jgi:hypothetical protein
MRRQYTIVGVASVLLAAFTIQVWWSVTRPQEPPNEANWKPPAIEQCDKPLWDRIRKLCDK